MMNRNSLTNWGARSDRPIQTREKTDGRVAQTPTSVGRESKDILENRKKNCGNAGVVLTRNLLSKSCTWIPGDAEFFFLFRRCCTTFVRASGAGQSIIACVFFCGPTAQPTNAVFCVCIWTLRISVSQGTEAVFVVAFIAGKRSRTKLLGLACIFPRVAFGGLRCWLLGAEVARPPPPVIG